MFFGWTGLTVLVAVVATLIIVATAGQDAPEVDAQVEPTVELVAIDADPTGNTATSLGTIEDCMVVAPGGTATVDLVVDEVPEEGLASFGLDVLYDPSILQLISVDYNLLIVAGGGGTFIFADPLPDTDGDYRIDVADLTTNYEVGPGVLIRAMFQTVGTGLSQVVPSDEINQDGTPKVIRPSGLEYPVNEIRSATIAAGGACPSPADLRTTSVSIDVPAGASVVTPVSIQANSTVENRGPYGPVNGDVTTTLLVPPDCAVLGGPGQVTQDVPLPVSQPVTLTESFTVTCEQASFHSITARSAIVVDDPVGIESNHANNQQTSVGAIMPVVGEADLQLNAPVPPNPAPEPFSGMQFNYTAVLPVTNGGPYGPTTARVSATLSLPQGCTSYSPNPAVTDVAVGANEIRAANVSWKLVCTGVGVHNFSVSPSVSTGDLHVVDPDGGVGPPSSQDLTVFVGACGEDPNPAGDIIQNMSPQLLALIGQLTSDGTEVPEQYRKQLQCAFDKTASDVALSPIGDCPVGLVAEQPCSLSYDLSIDIAGGTTPGIPSVRLAPVGVVFVPAAYDWAGDAEVPNGSPNGSGRFRINTDGGLLPNGTACTVDVRFDPKHSYEGAIAGNAPESNDIDDLSNPHVWPNDLNAERAAVESSFTLDPMLPPGVTLWSRTIVPLNSFGVKLPLNVLTWKITNPTYQAITGGQWVVVSFPGDALNPDQPGSLGGNPDSDDPIPGPVPVTTCAPHNVQLAFNGMAGGAVFLACKATGSHMTWELIDPDARGVTGDEGPRSDTATCSADLDGDGVSQDAETYWGTNALSTDTDGDGVSDGSDNCKLVVNALQEDLDGDRTGDPCDDDDDGDSIADAADNCAREPNTGQDNAVHPATTPGDHCDDPDEDNVMDVSDNCPDVYNPSQPNNVHPDLPPGDNCDDPDGDAVVDVDDNCIDTPNPQQENNVHPSSPAGDHCDDPDGDAFADVIDNCPDVSNPGQENDDGDGFGNVCDHCPGQATAWRVPANDSDCDGFPDTTMTEAARGRENFIGTDPADRCGDTAIANDEDGPGESPWPPDFNDNQRANISDIVLIGPSFNQMGPGLPYDPRFDLNASGAVTLSDVVAIGPFFNKVCTP
jgi:hypothetical protein